MTQRCHVQQALQLQLGYDRSKNSTFSSDLRLQQRYGKQAETQLKHPLNGWKNFVVVYSFEHLGVQNHIGIKSSDAKQSNAFITPISWLMAFPSQYPEGSETHAAGTKIWSSFFDKSQMRLLNERSRTIILSQKITAESGINWHTSTYQNIFCQQQFVP